MTSSYRVLQAVQHLRAGGVIAYPTEAVWGLGCDPRNGIAIARLLALKNRSPAKGLIMVAASRAQFGPLLSGLDELENQRFEQGWPRPMTWLVPHRGLVHPLVCGRSAKVALRVSDHPLVEILCNRFGGPVISTSANPQGRAPALDCAQVRGYFGKQIDYILQGSLGMAAAPSEIRDLASGELIRSGTP